MQYKLTVTETGSRSSALLEKKKSLKITSFGIRFCVWKKKKKKGSHGKKIKGIVSKELKIQKEIKTKHK